MSETKVETTLDRITAKRAQNELKFTRSTFYRRCAKAGIKRPSQGISKEEFGRLQEMQERRGELSQKGYEIQSNAIALKPKEVDAIQIIDAIAQLLTPPQTTDLFHIQRSLEEAATNEWLLTREQVCELFGYVPSTLRKMRVIQKYGFTLVKVAQGRSRLWVVKKETPKNILLTDQKNPSKNGVYNIVDGRLERRTV